MIGTYGEGLNAMEYRDRSEYRAMQFLIQTMPSLQAQGKVVTASMMREFRNNWMKNGERFDFARHFATASDVENLLRLTGATTFGSLDSYPTLREGIAAKWSEFGDTYNRAVANGVYLHVITDTELTERLGSAEQQSGLNKAVFSHVGSSLRSLNPGDTFELRDKGGQAVVYSGQVSTLESTFATAPVQSPAQMAASASAATTAGTSAPPAAPDTVAEAEWDGSPLMGWHGGYNDDYGKELRGLSHVVGAYLTKADGELVAKNFDETVLIPENIAQNSVELLRHMRSSGYDFNVRDNGNRNQIEARLQTGENLSVRIFDADANGSYIGRMYDSYNQYYFNVRGDKRVKENTKFEPKDAIAVMDYVVGNHPGKVFKSNGSESSRVELQGISSRKSLHVQPTKNRYHSLVFEDAATAETYIREGIDESVSFVKGEFKAQELQALIDWGLDTDDVLITGAEFQSKLEELYSNDAIVREAQERVAAMAVHSNDGGAEYAEKLRDGIVGSYEDGFNPAFVVDHRSQTDRGNERDAMMAALKTAGYDISKLQGNEFAVNAMRERLVTFNPDTAKSMDDVENPMMRNAMQTVRDTLKSGGFLGKEGYGSEPDVLVDENGIIRWEANRQMATAAGKPKKWQTVSGDIGQVMVPDEDGIIRTNFQGGGNYGIVPGYTGYFSFEGDYDNRMERFRVKGYEQHLEEKLRSQVTHQMTRPFNKALDNIPSTLDASGLNGLYHGDVYGKRIELDFMETNQLNVETKQAIITTLSNRVRFDNQFSEYATTSAETQANRDMGSGDNTGAFSYWLAAGETNMRVLDADLENYADLTMTGTGKTQGLIWYLADGAEVDSEGKVTKSKGIELDEGVTVPDGTAIQKLPYFENKDFNAWDRNQMSANQLMTALRVDEKVNTALMSFGGWTFDDSYAVSKEFAERNQVMGSSPNERSMDVLEATIEHVAAGGSKDDVLNGTGMLWSDEVIRAGIAARDAGLDEDVSYDAFIETHGRFRPLQRGDKLSDFGGNKGTIGIVIDRNMPEDEAKKQKLDKEVRFMKANPDLDVVSAPYSMLSRHNAGVVKELMGGNVKDLVDPDTGEVFKGAMGQLNIIVTDMKVDEKTHAYTREDVLDGKGRKASGQLAWALQSKGAAGILNEIYGRNDSAWATYREYLIATGLDMKADGTMVQGYTPHADEERFVFEYDSDKSPAEFLETIRDNGGFLQLPFEMGLRSGATTSQLPVLSASLRQNVELVDGSMRRSDFTNHYANIYTSVGDYLAAESDADRDKAQQKVVEQFGKVQDTIIDRQFNGGHNGKHSYLRDKIMGKRLMHSATGVAVVDPRLNIGEVGMNEAMMSSLDAKPGDTVMMWRDPVWRDGAIRAAKVVHDETVHGVSFNPISDKSHDGDFDGDTYGVAKFTSKAAMRDLVEKFSHHANMIDGGNGKDQLYFQSGMDLASGEAMAARAGDTKPKELYERAHKNALSDDKRLQRKALRDLNEYSHMMFRKYGFGGDYVSLTDKESVFESFSKMVENGAKGNPKGLDEYKAYHNGEKTMADAREVQYATGVKSDDTGLAGAFSQKLVSVVRNQNITAALESMYPLTQGTLQIKKDAQHARVVNELLTNDLNKTFRGVEVVDSKRKLTPSKFKAQLTDIMENKMKVSVNEKHMDALTDSLTHDGRLLPLKDAMRVKGSPMDKVAYGGGFDALVTLANEGKSLLEGEQNKLFAPFSMRNANESTKIAAKDTQVRKDATVSLEKASYVAPEPDGVEMEDAGVSL